MTIFFGVLGFMLLILALSSPEFFRNLGFKLKYDLYSWSGSKEKMDAFNRESIEKSKKSGERVLLVIHGAGAQYYGDVYGTAIWLRQQGMNPVSFDYDYKEKPEDSVKKLASYVDSLLLETGKEKIDIYGICLGGVLARYYAEEYGGLSKIENLVTVISPAVSLPSSEIAYQYDKYFSFDPEPWNVVLEKFKNKNSVKKHLYIYCKKDIIVPTKYQFSENGNFLGLDCGHAFVNSNPEILQSGLDFISKQNMQ